MNFTVIVIFLLYAFLLAYLILIGIFIIGWLKKTQKEVAVLKAKDFVSIIIPARNEQENIQCCLKDIFSQNYPAHLFEVIVVDDHSEDKTPEIVQSFIVSNPGNNIKLVKLNTFDKEVKFKKMALQEGINTARAELIITTDADCRYGNKWLSSIVSCYAQFRPRMIVAPVCYHQESSWFDKLQSLDFLSLTGTTFASAHWGKPLMCNGANLAYEKKAFKQSGGYSGDETVSGDDVNLMQKFNRNFPGKIHFLAAPEAAVFTKAPSGMKEFLHQRTRWASKIRHYKASFPKLVGIILLGLNFLLILALILSALSGQLVEYFLIPFIAKGIIDFLFLFLVSYWFKKTDLLIWFIPAHILYGFYIAVMGFCSFTNHYQWKGRKVAVDG